MQQRLAKADRVGHAQRQTVENGRHRMPRSASREATVVPKSPTEEPSLAPQDVSDDIEESRALDPAKNAAPLAGGRWPRAVAFRLLPALMVVLGATAGVLTWEVISAHLLESARVDSVRAAQDGAAAILTYRPDTAAADLGAARDRLTGKFKHSYTLFTHQTVIPDAREKQISSMVYIPAAASVSATLHHAVVMVYVNQTFMHDPDPPTSTASSVRVTLEKVGRRWLISEFTPV
jgi:Mce-associated membrane protein